MQLKDKVTIITGASGGIGSELARRLAPLGVRLVLCGRSEEKLARLQEETRALGAETMIWVGDKGYPLQSAYAASKHALIGMTKSLANEVYDRGIRVHIIAPGAVYTDMVKISRPDLSPEGMILAEDIADIALFLLTHRTNAVIDEVQVHRAGKAPFA